MTILGLSKDVWAGAILGAIVIPLVLYTIRRLSNWWRASLPRQKVLGAIADNDEICTIFVRDFLLGKDSQLIAVEPGRGVGIVPNVVDLWGDVEGRGVSYVLNALGQVGKRHNISIVRMSQDTGIWDTNLIVMGAQAQKCFDFYDRLEGVMYRMDAHIGGFGTLGTAAAAYYFREHLPELGKQFGSQCFGIVVRASITAGEQTVERLPRYDRVE